jgi:DmsE family decaheme c-type cytochrome
MCGALAVVLGVTAIHSVADADQGGPVAETLQDALSAQGNYFGTETCVECHEGFKEQLTQRKHGQSADARTPMAGEGCESCHGPGERHIEVVSEEGEGGGLISFAGENAESRQLENRVCLQCHQGGELMHWQSSLHAAETLACTSCHQIHKPSAVLDRASQNDVCLQCHTGIRADIYRASSHPIREGNLVCSDCHNAHGSAGPASVNELSVNENCYRCHAELRGPFLWEHYPVSEDCSLCHRVHGSNHAALLNKSAPFLCQQCHQDIRAQGRRHVRRMFDFDFSDTRRRSRFVLGEGCMNCHSRVHGSNHPSGAALMR